MPAALPPDFDDIYRHLDDLRRWFDALLAADAGELDAPGHHDLLRSLRALAEDAEYRAAHEAAQSEDECSGSTSRDDYGAFVTQARESGARPTLESGTEPDAPLSVREQIRRSASGRAEAALGPNAETADLANMASDLEHDLLLSSPELRVDE